MTNRIAYGFRPGLPGFASLTAQAAGERLRQLGCDGVFVSQPERSQVEAFQAAGLRVYVEVGVFCGAETWEQFPDARPVTADGADAPVEEWYAPALPTHAGLRAHRLRQIEALAQSAPLDGIWLDFIRWPARWERPQPRLYHSSFDPMTLAQFQAATGIRLPSLTPAAAIADWVLAHAAAPWFAWRCRVIASFAAEARAVLHQHLPDALLGAFTVPWTDADFDQAFYRVVGQDPALLAEQIDVFSPMVYHRMCGRDVAWVGAVTRWVQECSGRATWPIIEAVAPPADYSPAELRGACQAAVEASGGPLIVFTLEGLLQDADRVEAWRSA